MRTTEIPDDYALVLQQLNHDGRDDIDELAEMVSVDRGRLQHVIKSLQHKGLIIIDNVGYETWLSLSSKGHNLIDYLRPNSGMGFQYE